MYDLKPLQSCVENTAEKKKVHQPIVAVKRLKRLFLNAESVVYGF